MTWTIRWSKQAASDMKRLAPEAQRRIIQKVHQSLAQPQRVWRRLRGGMGYRLRVGDWRVLADLDEAAQEIHVTAVGHRRNVYR